MRIRKLVAIGVSILVLAGAFFFVQRALSARQTYVSISTVVDDLVSNVRGQIGVYLGTNAATGLPMVNAMVPGSPAELAGLKPGDLISHVNDRSLSGVPVAQAASRIRGLNGGKVELRVQRAGTTNALNLTIRRTSVKTLTEQARR